MLKTWQKKFQVHFNNLTPKSNGNFANRETCSFIRLNDAFRETLLKAAEKTLQEPSSVEYARWFQTDIQRELWEVIKSAFGGGGGYLINSQLETHDSLSTAVYSVNINFKNKKKKEKQTNKILNKTRQKYMTKISLAIFC